MIVPAVNVPADGNKRRPVTFVQFDASPATPIVSRSFHLSDDSHDSLALWLPTVEIAVLISAVRLKDDELPHPFGRVTAVWLDADAKEVLPALLYVYLYLALVYGVPALAKNCRAKKPPETLP